MKWKVAMLTLLIVNINNQILVVAEFLLDLIYYSNKAS